VGLGAHTVVAGASHCGRPRVGRPNRLDRARTLDRGADGLSVPSVTEVGERPAGPSRGTRRRGVRWGQWSGPRRASAIRSAIVRPTSRLTPGCTWRRPVRACGSVWRSSRGRRKW